MLGRLWFSLCAFVAVLAFAFGSIVAVAVVGDVVLHNGRMQWDALATALVIGLGGPAACRFTYRWGLWVAGAKA